MKKIIVALFTAALCSIAHAEEYVATVKSSECQVIAKSGSVTGALTGGAVGGAVGAGVGKALFGKTGGWIGGLAGSVGGGMAGESLGSSKTYQCVIGFTDPKGKQKYYSVTGKKRSVGDTVKVFKSDDSVIVM